MPLEIMLISIAAICFGLITVFQKYASPAHPLIAAIVISGTASIAGLILFFTVFKGIKSERPEALIFAILGGLCAITIDIAAMKAYSLGLPLSVGGPILIGGSIAVSTLIGFITGEIFTWTKIAAIFLIVSGSIILSSGK